MTVYLFIYLFIDLVDETLHMCKHTFPRPRPRLHWSYVLNFRNAMFIHLP